MEVIKNYKSGLSSSFFFPPSLFCVLPSFLSPLILSFFSSFLRSLVVKLLWTHHCQQMLMITEISFSPGQTEPAAESAFGNILPGFLIISWLPPCSPWHCHPGKPPDISQKEPERARAWERRQCRSFSWAPGRSRIHHCGADSGGASWQQESSPATARHAGGILLAFTHWPSSQLPVSQGRSSRHWATINVCWRWSNLAWWQLQLSSLPEPLGGSESVGSLVAWVEQPMPWPPKVSLALPAEQGISVLLTWETEHRGQRAGLIKATSSFSAGSHQTLPQFLG